MEQIKDAIKAAVKELFGIDIEPELTRPDEQFGDYATNVALQLAGKLNQDSKEIAQAICQHVKGSTSHIKDIQMAGPGFINIHLSDTALWELTEAKSKQSLKGKTVVAEYSDPNPFKVLHAGHLYTSVVGDAIANLLEAAGAEVHRVNFGGDVGLHVAKTMWAILKNLGYFATNGHSKKIEDIPKNERAEWLSEQYIEGTNAYDNDAEAKELILELNHRVYDLHPKEPNKDIEFAHIYWTTREWSYEYFNQFYTLIGTKFEKYYPESEVAELGITTVKEHIQKGVFEESEGAIVFKGESYGLHTRVFINKEGLPTYETKDVGLIFQKKKDYNFDISVVITGNEQEQYMQVVLKAVEQFAPDLVHATKHLTHGIVKLKGGVKMSSRKGNILRAVDVLSAAEEANKKATGKKDNSVVLGAVKYAFLKQRTGGDIIYNPSESVALEGNSGPYLQYAHARARSILSKVDVKGSTSHTLEGDERSLLRKIGQYNEVVEQATSELMPHHICTYLYELAQTFNRFYEQNRVVGDEREQLRARLVQKYADTLKSGLKLLGIVAPEKM